MMQEGRTSRNGAQGACVILTSKYSTGSKMVKELVKKPKNTATKRPRMQFGMEQWSTFDAVEDDVKEDALCLREGLVKIFTLSDPDGKI